MLLGRDIVRSMRGMDDQRGPTRSKPSPGRPPEVFRVVHSQQSRQHRCRAGTMSGGQAGAALAAPGGNDGAAGAGPHPQTKAVGTAATPVARLKSALAHGKTPPSSGYSTIRYVLTRHASQSERAGGSRRCKRPSNGTGRRQTGQTGANLGDEQWAPMSSRHAEHHGEYRRPACVASTRLLASRLASQFSDSYRSRQRSLVSLNAGGPWYA